MSSMFFHLFGLIDPYKEFVLMERSRKLLVLRAVLFFTCIIGFIVYAAFAFSSYVGTPEPSDLSAEKQFPGNKALFQFSFGIPVDATTRDPIWPTTYTSPFSSTLTVGTVTPYPSTSSVPPPIVIPGNKFVYQIYTFPVYGTVDATTLTSTLLYFQPCKYYCSYNFPLLFFVGAPDTAKYDSLLVTRHSPQDYRVSQPGSSTQFLLLYDNFNANGPEISISLTLAKFVSSAGVSTYNASIVGAPSLSPPTRIPYDIAYNLPAAQPQRTIAITVQPTVDVVTNSPKNILNLLGSIAGIFPLIVSVGGIVSSIIWSKFGPQNTGSSEELKSEQVQ